ncbi:porin [Shewanella algae]|uniref:Outer membrane phosphoporin protein E n=1 Tax=Shewanella algae TaxID=38313 RepID=A0A379Z370_9GAMM|nr:porin [Shewanella algae]SUI54635.1 outer membrane phosphoporin protein E [Shewanella algae]
MKGSSPAIKPIALLVISILASFTASAVEIYGDENNQVIVGGRLQLHVINTQGKTEMANAGSRVRFGFDHKLNNGWVIDTLFEWGVNAVGKTDLVYSSDSALHAESDDFLSNRLGYVGFSHENYGRLSFGKQWGYGTTLSVPPTKAWCGMATLPEYSAITKAMAQSMVSAAVTKSCNTATAGEHSSWLFRHKLKMN